MKKRYIIPGINIIMAPLTFLFIPFLFDSLISKLFLLIVFATSVLAITKPSKENSTFQIIILTLFVSFIIFILFILFSDDFNSGFGI